MSAGVGQGPEPTPPTPCPRAALRDLIPVCGGCGGDTVLPWRTLSLISFQRVPRPRKPTLILGVLERAHLPGFVDPL